MNRRSCAWRTLMSRRLRSARSNVPRRRRGKESYLYRLFFILAADFSAEVDAFAAGFTYHALPFVSGKFFGRQFDFDPLRGEQIVICDFAVGQHLLLILVCDFRMHLASQGLRGFFGCDADRLAGADVDKSRCDFSPIAKLQGTLAQAATRDDGHGIGGAAVDLDEGDESLAVLASWIVDTQLLETQHRQTHAEDLSGAKMAVSLLGITKIFVKGFHKSYGLSAVSLTSQNYFLLQRTPSFVFSIMIPAAV